MPIKMTTNEDALMGYVNQQIDTMLDGIVEKLMYAGEQCVNTARMSHTYKDRTGNLTSSIGYVVVRDGEIVSVSGFDRVLEGSDGQKGGRSYATSLARKIGSGKTALIVVAGMDYAYYVKAKGFDVIDSAEIQAQTLVPRLLKQLGLN